LVGQATSAGCGGSGGRFMAVPESTLAGMADLRVPRAA
jgi:hypothetical protein